MKGFIEVVTEGGEQLLINVAFIVSVQDNVVELSIPGELGSKQLRYIHVVDSYTKLKNKIEEAKNV